MDDAPVCLLADELAEDLELLLDDLAGRGLLGGATPLGPVDA